MNNIRFFGFLFVSVLLAQSSFAATWYLKGYLPETQTKSVLEIQDRVIKEVMSEAEFQKRTPNEASKKVIDTEAWIFPGMIDLHGHLKYHVLPFWNVSQARFANRFEWRDYFPEYKTATTFNLRALPSYSRSTDPFKNLYPNCAAIRWAELKALVSGVTGVQGIGIPTAICGENYGPHNVDVAGDIFDDRTTQKTGAYSKADLFSPNTMRDPFIPYIEPLVSTNQSSDEKAYQEAIEKLKSSPLRAGISIHDWIQNFMTLQQDINTGVYLLTGLDYQLSTGMDIQQFDQVAYVIQADLERIYLEEIKEEIKYDLKSFSWDVNSKAPERTPSYVQDLWKKSAITLAQETVSQMRQWLTEYLNTPQTQLNDSKLAEKFLYQFGENQTSRSVVSIFPTTVMRYLSDFEVRTRQRMIQKMDHHTPVILHLAEGATDDLYTQQEWQWSKKLGVLRKGLIAIHGLGLQVLMDANGNEIQNDYAHAKNNDVAIVWSPLSQLTLYGSTMDIEKAVSEGVNVSLGTDWSVSGSKNLLDELRFAWNYIQKNKLNVSAEQLVSMVSYNPAKALQLEDKLGSVSGGFQADLTLIERRSESGYLDFVQSRQEHIGLVVVAGEPLYGDQSYMNKVSSWDGSTLETLPSQISAKPACVTAFSGVLKSLRIPNQSLFNELLDKEKQSLEKEKLSLNQNDAGQKHKIDQITEQLSKYENSLITATEVESELQTRFSDYRKQVEQSDLKHQTHNANDLIQAIDPMFACEDSDYMDIHENFLNKVFPEYLLNREDNRRGFDVNFHPVTTPMVEVDLK